jgi:hypothetical protein
MSYASKMSITEPLNMLHHIARNMTIESSAIECLRLELLTSAWGKRALKALMQF